MEILLSSGQSSLRMPEEEVNFSSEEHISPQSFESNPKTFENLPLETEFLKKLSYFKNAALQEGWDILVEATKKDSSSNRVDSCVIRCFMHDKNSKRTADRINNIKTEAKSLKTNCKCRYSIKLKEKNVKNDYKSLCYKTFSFESKHNHPKNYGFKIKITDEIENWVKIHFDPKRNRSTALQKLLLKQFKQEFSLSQLTYLLHRLFHKRVHDVQSLVTQILQKNTHLDYKIGFDEVKHFVFFVLIDKQLNRASYLIFVSLIMKENYRKYLMLSALMQLTTPTSIYYR